jgi:hypothetical protein
LRGGQAVAVCFGFEAGRLPGRQQERDFHDVVGYDVTTPQCEVVDVRNEPVHGDTHLTKEFRPPNRVRTVAAKVVPQMDKEESCEVRSTE